MCYKETDAGNSIETYSKDNLGQLSPARVAIVFTEDRY